MPLLAINDKAAGDCTEVYPFPVFFSVHMHFFLLNIGIIFYILLCKLLFTFYSILQTLCLTDYSFTRFLSDSIPSYGEEIE